MNLHDPLVKVRVTCVICSSAAIISTIYRLYVRRRRIWADDGFAFFSMLFLAVQVVAVFLNPGEFSSLEGTGVGMPTSITANGIGATRYYMMANMFYSIIWSARLSILFSIIRIDPDITRRYFMKGAAVLFGVAWVILIGQIYWECEPEPNWKSKPVPQCELNADVGICQLISDIVSDSLLLLTPIRLFLVIRDKWLRYRLMMIFSTCIMTTIVSLAHTAYVIEAAGNIIVMVALVENCISLIVCNVPVIVTSIVNLQESNPLDDGLTNLKFISFGERQTVTTLGTLPAHH
ncbi:hypothetical protein BDQ12DRAFT_738409 [Crucibulum laeve]|uniref:Rhodopsin domain-containing protein n=1 Tax=Crucibulum laeve TaxID=68775 RepID=A0A5C3LPV1_9AGAR|nr:hypothetical protein BDQ12DRAFT_738409 [Crucibulum laeve]